MTEEIIKENLAALQSKLDAGEAPTDFSAALFNCFKPCTAVSTGAGACQVITFGGKNVELP